VIFRKKFKFLYFILLEVISINLLIFSRPFLYIYILPGFTVVLNHLIKVLQIIESNNYVINLPLNFDIISTFDTKDLVICKTQQPIPDIPFETLAPLSLSLAQNKHINVTLNVQVVFTRDGELQQILVYELDNQIQTILGLLERHHNSLIIENVIGVTLTYT